MIYLLGVAVFAAALFTGLFFIVLVWIETIELKKQLKSLKK